MPAIHQGSGYKHKIQGELGLQQTSFEGVMQGAWAQGAVPSRIASPMKISTVRFDLLLLASKTFQNARNKQVFPWRMDNFTKPSKPSSSKFGSGIPVLELYCNQELSAAIWFAN